MPTITALTTLPGKARAEALGAALETLEPAPDGVGVFEMEDGSGLWEVGGYFTDPPDQVALALLAAAHGAKDFAVSEVPDTDWVAEVNRRSPPVAVGRFFVRGRHVEQAPPANSHTILLDAGAAFGTGTHETTRGCLLAIDGMDPPAREAPILDLGTGSGILAIAVALAWDRPVLAADNDPVATAVARENADENGVGALIETRTSQGFSNPRLRSAGPYGLIIANILAQPLIGLASPIARNLRGDGRAILSGLLIEQEPAVARAYAAHGLAIRQRIVIGKWPTLVVGR